MSTQTLILQNPSLLLCQPRTTALSRTSKPTAVLFNSRPVSFRSTFAPLASRRSPPNSISGRACSTTLADVESPTRSLLTGTTRTITTLLAIVITASKFFAEKIVNFAQRQSIVNSVGPAFFAAIGDDSAGTLNTPFTVVAAGMAKWLDIYSGVLMVRVLLSWFPNIPWDRQPFSAVRDLCDPYLNLFRNIIPPIFDTLDVSPLLAFAVLGTLGSILKSSGGGF